MLNVFGTNEFAPAREQILHEGHCTGFVRRQVDACICAEETPYLTLGVELGSEGLGVNLGGRLSLVNLLLFFHLCRVWRIFKDIEFN